MNQNEEECKFPNYSISKNSSTVGNHNKLEQSKISESPYKFAYNRTDGPSSANQCSPVALTEEAVNK